VTIIFAIVSSHFHFCTSPDYGITYMCMTLAIVKLLLVNWTRKKLAITRTHLNTHMHSSRMIQVQMQMAERALELLSLPADQPCYILDVG